MTTTRRPPVDVVSRKLEALPLRLRLIAILLVLLLAALTLTAGATAVLMRRDLVGRVDSDLDRAYLSVAQQALNRIVRQQDSRLPSGYAVIFYPADGSNSVELDPTSESTSPDMPPSLPITSPHVLSRQPFYIGSDTGDLKWRAIAGRTRDFEATFIVAVPLTPWTGRCASWS